MPMNPNGAGSGTTLTSNPHLTRVGCWPKSTSESNNVHDALGFLPLKDPNKEFGEGVSETPLMKLGLSKRRKWLSLKAVNGASKVILFGAAKSAEPLDCAGATDIVKVRASAVPNTLRHVILLELYESKVFPSKNQSKSQELAKKK